MIGDGDLQAETTRAFPGNVVLAHTEEASALMKAFDVPRPNTLVSGP